MVIYKFTMDDNDEPIVLPPIYDDDEPVVLPPGTTTMPGRVQLITRNNDKAPLEENIQKVILELTGEDKSRAGLDLVVVLDMDITMSLESEEEIKTAMLFLIKKLSVVDRLSIVKPGCGTNRLCPLRQMTESTKTELQNKIKYLVYFGKHDIIDGLETALNILKCRSFRSGRVGAIMLMSNDQPTRAVPVCNVPVHTFGFGEDQDHKFLKNIADNSRLGGTYSYVRINNLTEAFSQCLGGLLSVVAQDLTMTVRQIEDESTINQVSSGSYQQSKDHAAGSVNITFGDIYIQEIRKVLVDLHLLSTRKKQDADVLEVSYTYKFNGQLFESSPATVTVCRMSGLTAEEQQALPEVRVEEVRLLIAEVIKQATTDAEKDDLKGAQDKLVNGLHKLEDADIEMLKANLRPEMEELLKFMQLPEIYEEQILPFGYSLHISLATQRQTARGNNIGKFQLFATPAMQKFLEEAKKLDDINDVSDFSDSGTEKPTVSGLMKLTITNNDIAPIEENIQKVLLELSCDENSYFGLDLVAVLDVSSSMEGDKLAKMKIAMLLLLKNLSEIDDLSIVEYSSKAKMLCPLLEMTVSSKRKIENLIDDLKPQPGTNITDGLATALNILKDCSLSSGRVGVILLMSDGKQNQGGDAANVAVDNVRVLAFGFGEDHNPEVLIAIANNSLMGGTYAEVCMDNLNLTFPQCIDDLQSVGVWDLTMTVTQIKNESTVKRASAGRYLQSIDNATGSVTITFDTLYIQEVRKVLVEILLPVTRKEDKADVLKVSYRYRTSFDGELNEANSSTVTVHRMSELTAEQKRPRFEVTAVEARLLIAEMIKQATSVANNEDLLFFRNKLLDCLIIIRLNPDKDILLLRADLGLLRAKLEKLSKLMQSQAINEKQSRSFAYSSQISQFSQRGWARGNDTITIELFGSPAMREFIEEAKMYDEIDDLHIYIDRFICAMDSIIIIINKVMGISRERLIRRLEYPAIGLPSAQFLFVSSDGV